MLKRQHIKPNSASRESYSSVRKTCFEKISCFSRAGVRSSVSQLCFLTGGVCLSGLLLFTFLAINPMSTSVYAEGDTTEEDYDIDTHATTVSTVGISFSPAAGSTSLTPTTSAGQSAQINVLATVNVQNSGGYSVYLKSNTQNLVGQNHPTNVVPGIQGERSYDNLASNTWGYYANEGSSVPEGATYKAVSVTGNGDKVAENVDSKIVSDTKNIMLSFAAKIGNEMPADTYQNTVTMSVVSSPVQFALSDITNMQQMTPEICENTPTEPALGSTKQLQDVRDGKYYWVTKLKDNNCWMTQNLDLDITTADGAINDKDNTAPVEGVWPDAALSDYDEVPTTPVYVTSTIANAETINSSYTSTYSWSLGDVAISVPTESNSCGYPRNNALQCTTQFVAYLTPTTDNNAEKAHYVLGNHYTWNTATAGTGDLKTSGQAENSICPKGWQLPASNASGTHDFSTLISVGDIGMNVAALTSAPYYFVRGGYIRQGADLYVGAGDEGDYWSSIPKGNSIDANDLYFGGTGYITNPSTYPRRNLGVSVRCIAR